MKARALSRLIFFGLFILLALIALPQQAARAQNCGYDQNKQPIPCPPGEKEKKATKTPIPPSKTPIPPTATDTKAAAVQQSVPLISQDPSNPPPCAANPDQGSAPDTGSALQGGNTLFPWLMGGGGLLGGILIGLLIGGIVGPTMNRGGMTPPDGTRPTSGELLPAIDMFHKDQDGGGTFHKLDNDNAGVWTKDEFYKVHDPSKKASGFIKGQADVNGDNNFAKFHGEADVNGDGNTAAGPGGGPHIDSEMGDGSV